MDFTLFYLLFYYMVLIFDIVFFKIPNIFHNLFKNELFSFIFH